MVDLEELREFVFDSNRLGYATTEPVPGRTEVKEPDGTTTITYEQGDWKSVDNYGGGEPYAGATKVFHKGRLEFMFVYYGAVVPNVPEAEFVYEVLRKALRNPPRDYPYRGPASMHDGETNSDYKNEWEGKIDQFHGREEITTNGQQTYWAMYMGGLVDQRKD